MQTIRNILLFYCSENANQNKIRIITQYQSAIIETACSKLTSKELNEAIGEVAVLCVYLDKVQTI